MNVKVYSGTLYLDDGSFDRITVKRFIIRDREIAFHMTSTWNGATTLLELDGVAVHSEKSYIASDIKPKPVDANFYLVTLTFEVILGTDNDVHIEGTWKNKNACIEYSGELQLLNIGPTPEFDDIRNITRSAILKKLPKLKPDQKIYPTLNLQMASKKVSAPRPSPKQPKAFKPEGDATRLISWKVTYEAILEFQNVARNAAETLEGLEIASPIVNWLETEAIPGVDDYMKQLIHCSNNVAEAVSITNSFREEEDYISTLLSFINSTEDLVGDTLGEDVPEKIREDIINFIDEKIQPVRERGWHMYHVFIQAV